MFAEPYFRKIAVGALGQWWRFWILDRFFSLRPEGVQRHGKWKQTGKAAKIHTVKYRAHEHITVLNLRPTNRQNKKASLLRNRNLHALILR